MATQKLFVEWEWVLYSKYLKRNDLVQQWAGAAPAVTALAAQGYELTVDQVRAAFNGPPHPDGATAPQRGSALITATDNPQAGDTAAVPPLAALQAVRAQLQLENLNTAWLALQYPELWAATGG